MVMLRESLTVSATAMIYYKHTLIFMKLPDRVLLALLNIMTKTQTKRRLFVHILVLELVRIA